LTSNNTLTFTKCSYCQATLFKWLAVVPLEDGSGGFYRIPTIWKFVENNIFGFTAGAHTYLF